VGGLNAEREISGKPDCRSRRLARIVNMGEAKKRFPLPEDVDRRIIRACPGTHILAEEFCPAEGFSELIQ